MRRVVNYVKAVLIGLDVTLNALTFGRKYQTISCRIGESIRDNTWAAHVPWPACFAAHCKKAIFKTIV